MKTYKIIKTANYNILYKTYYNAEKLENARKKLAEMRKNGEVLNYGPKSRKALIRVREKIHQIIDLNITSEASLLTLTYAEAVKDYALSLKLFNKFVKRVEYSTSQKLSYLATKELQKKTRGGVIHYHLIVFSHSNLTHQDWAKLWGHGFIVYTKLFDYNVARISNYLSGNLIIDKNQSIKKGQRVYHCSRDLIRPNITIISEKQAHSLTTFPLTSELNWSTALIIGEKK